MSYHMSALLSLDQRAKEVTLCQRVKPPTAHGSAKIIVAYYQSNGNRNMVKSNVRPSFRKIK